MCPWRVGKATCRRGQKECSSFIGCLCTLGTSMVGSCTVATDKTVGWTSPGWPRIHKWGSGVVSKKFWILFLSFISLEDIAFIATLARHWPSENWLVEKQLSHLKWTFLATYQSVTSLSIADQCLWTRVVRIWKSTKPGCGFTRSYLENCRRDASA